MAERTYTREEILEAMTLRPCHVTGLHNPSHTTEHVCDIQRSNAFRGVLDLLGVTEIDLPRRLHDDEYWCRGIPSQEEYRQRNRELYEWAGEDIPDELAAPAPDAPVFDKPKSNVLRAVKRLTKEVENKEGWVSNAEVAEALDTEIAKVWRPIKALVKEGKLKDSSGMVYHSDGVVKTKPRPKENS